MGPRAWAAIGNYLRITAALSYMVAAMLGYWALDASLRGAPGGRSMQMDALGAVFFFLYAVLFWNLKGPLVSGNVIARLIIGAWTLLYVITSLGLFLIVLGVIYLFTGEPDSSQVYGRVKTPKPRFKPPRNWQPNGRVGPSGATVYADTNRGALIGMFDSWLPVQLLERRDGYTRVIAASGEAGWIDDRTVTEGV